MNVGCADRPFHVEPFGWFGGGHFLEIVMLHVEPWYLEGQSRQIPPQGSASP